MAFRQLTDAETQLAESISNQNVAIGGPSPYASSTGGSASVFNKQMDAIQDRDLKRLESQQGILARSQDIRAQARQSEIQEQAIEKDAIEEKQAQEDMGYLETALANRRPTSEINTYLAGRLGNKHFVGALGARKHLADMVRSDALDEEKSAIDLLNAGVEHELAADRALPQNTRTIIDANRAKIESSKARDELETHEANQAVAVYKAINARKGKVQESLARLQQGVANGDPSDVKRYLYKQGQNFNGTPASQILEFSQDPANLSAITQAFDGAGDFDKRKAMIDAMGKVMDPGFSKLPDPAKEEAQLAWNKARDDFQFDVQNADEVGAAKYAEMKQKSATAKYQANADARAAEAHKQNLEEGKLDIAIKQQKAGDGTQPSEEELKEFSDLATKLQRDYKEKTTGESNNQILGNNRGGKAFAPIDQANYDLIKQYGKKLGVDVDAIRKTGVDNNAAYDLTSLLSDVKASAGSSRGAKAPAAQPTPPVAETLPASAGPGLPLSKTDPSQIKLFGGKSLSGPPPLPEKAP